MGTLGRAAALPRLRRTRRSPARGDAGSRAHAGARGPDPDTDPDPRTDPGARDPGTAAGDPDPGSGARPPKPKPEGKPFRLRGMIGQGEQLDASLLRIGQEFAGYRVEAGLGRQSGVGRVYEATHLESDRRVALKVFTGAAFRDPALRARFQQTTQVQARLRHPSVVRVEDWGVEPLRSWSCR